MAETTKSAWSRGLDDLKAFGRQGLAEARADLRACRAGPQEICQDLAGTFTGGSIFSDTTSLTAVLPQGYG